MVLDSIHNGKVYEGLGKNFQKAIDYLQSNDLNALTDGTHEIDGRNVYVNVMTTRLHVRSGNRYEVHKKYADIQVPLSTVDRIAVCPLDCTVEREPYNDASDTFFVNGGDASMLIVRPGMMAILMPEDAHDPGLTEKEDSEPIRKAVIKVRL